MSVVGRLFSNGELDINGELNERLPAVTGGLIAHYPFDNTVNGVKNSNILDYSSWSIGSTGSQTGFSQNGDGNSIVEEQDPVGNYTAVWQTLGNDVTSDADGGWNTPWFPIDNTKLYRFSTWVKRRVLGNGTFYLGCHGYGSVNGVYNNADGVSNNTNPYFTYRSWDLPLDEWILVVGHIFPYDNTNTSMHVDSGYYNASGEKIANCIFDFRWRIETTQADHRSYLYYSTDSTTHQLWVYPRVDICDGTEPSISNLIMCMNDCTNPSTNVNTTVTNDGIFIEESTTNMWSGTRYSWTSGTGVVTRDFSPTYFDKPYPNLEVVKIQTSSVGTEFSTIPWTVSGITGPGTTYTYSAWIYLEEGSYCKLYQHWNPWISGPKEYIEKHTWTRVSMTITTVDNTHPSIAMQFSTDGTIYVTAPQYEQKPFRTSFVNGTRGNGSLDLVTPMVAPYTLNFDFTPLVPNDYSGVVNWVFSHSPYNNEFIMWKRTTEDYYRIRINGSDYAFSNTDIVQGGEYNVTMIIGISNTQIYLNGEYKGSISKTTNIGSIALGYTPSNPGSNKFRSVSVFDRELTPMEVDKLANRTFSITKEGNLNSMTLREQPPYVPVDSYYFPLDHNTSDRFGLVNPRTDVGTSHCDSAVWVGKGCANLYTNVADNSFGVKSGRTLECMYHSPEEVIYKLVFTGELWNYKGWDIAVDTSKDYTLSGWMYVSKDFDGSYTPRIVGEQGFSHTLNYDISMKGTWQYMECTYKPTTTTARILMYATPNNNSGTRGYMMFKNVAFYQRPLSPPFNAGTTPDSSLSYNLYEDIGLDWSKDWSIVYFKKPVGTNADNLFGYNIDSLGCNSNSVGGGYFWFGKASSSNSIYNSTPSALDPTKYFGNWRMISLTKTGANITIKEWSYSEGIYTRIQSTTVSTPNYYVTQYGYDFKLGGWDNGNSVNSYYRDLIVVKRCLSDDEVSSMFKVGMSASVGTLYVSNILKESYIL